MPPRVAVLLGSHGHGSGAERVLEYLLHGAINRRADIALISPRSATSTRIARDLGYSWVPWEAGTDSLRENAAAFRRLRRDPLRVDVVHSWHTRHLEWAWLLGRRWRVPSSGTLHDDPSPPHRLVGRLRRHIIRHAATRLDGVVSVSQAVANRCEDLGWRRPITIIRNGLPPTPPHPLRSEIPGILRIGFMASGLLWKGAGLLPPLIARTAGLPVQWSLFGAPSPETAGIMDQLARQPQVRCFGIAPLEEALSHMDVMLHLSLDLDPYPTVLLEAARAGLPAIATRTGGSPEIVIDGKTGFLIPARDIEAAASAIRRLVDDHATYHAMGVAARARYESEFQVDRMVAGYFTFWDGLRPALA